jgi:hypothetical protein
MEIPCFREQGILAAEAGNSFKRAGKAEQITGADEAPLAASGTATLLIFVVSILLKMEQDYRVAILLRKNLYP